jgi:transposase InsO family protein
MDFVMDQLQDGTRFRPLTIVDVHTRKAVAIEVGQSLKGDDVVRTLNQLKLNRGLPQVLFCDSGSEFTSQAMDLWAYRNSAKIDFSRPGKPTDNAFVAIRACTGRPKMFRGVLKLAFKSVLWSFDRNTNRLFQRFLSEL